MNSADTLKSIAIMSLLAIYIVDAITFQIDHTFLITLVSIIAGLAGYSIGRQKTETERRKEKKNNTEAHKDE